MTPHNDESHTDSPEQDAPPPAPRWVKVFLVVLGILLLSVIILHLTGHRVGGHGEHRVGLGGETSDSHSATSAGGV